MPCGSRTSGENPDGDPGAHVRKPARVIVGDVRDVPSTRTSKHSAPRPLSGIGDVVSLHPPRDSAQEHAPSWRVFRDHYPAAMTCLADDLQASLAHLRLPVRHRTNARTTNLLERTFEEERRRFKVIPRFGDEKSAMKLVVATLLRVSDRWNRVSVSDATGGRKSDRQSVPSSLRLPLLKAASESAPHPRGDKNRGRCGNAARRYVWM
jgi:hypothetical protein